MGRVTNEVSGNSESNNWLDNSSEFSILMMFLDIVQVADVTKTLGTGSLYSKFVQNKPFGKHKLLKMYQGMTRENRKKLAKEMLQFNYRALRDNQKLLKEVLRGKQLLADGQRAKTVYSQIQVQKLIRTSFYKSFLSPAVLKQGVAAGVASSLTLQGSGGNLLNKAGNAFNSAKESINFAIGVSHRS